MYTLNKNTQVIYRTTDGTWIPVSIDNIDYQAYLIWLAEGNIPTPADIN